MTRNSSLGAIVTFVAWLMAVALAAPGVAVAEQKILQLRWNELPNSIVDKQVRVGLTDGVRLEGRGVSVGADALVVDVQKSSDPVRLHKTASVPRPTLAVLEVRQSGWKWKVISPIIGFIGLGALGAGIGHLIDPSGFIISNGASKGATVGMLSGIGAGLVVGWLADRRYVRIEIVP